MESMRSLNTSLPAAYSSRQLPPEQLLQAFKTAALSVTNLYKAAVTDQTNNRAAGYQDALDDLMRFLDHENLGLQDGEGWRVRQWVSERYDGTANQPQTDEEDRTDNEQRAQSAPPPAHHTETQTQHQNQAAFDENKDVQISIRESSPPVQPDAVYRFTAGGSNSSHLENRPATNEIEQPSHPIRVELINRTSRPSHRTSHRKSSTRDFTSLAGTKRKFPIPDFFNITNIDLEEHGGENKRSRFT
jgi:Domain of unknown function (DUF4588)